MSAQGSKTSLAPSKYQKKYNSLKRKLHTLIQENEIYKEELARCEQKLLRLNKDKNFLLDRLLEYDGPGCVSSDSDSTDVSDVEPEPASRRKPETPSDRSPTKKKRHVLKGKSQNWRAFSDNGHMTPEEVERHLEARTSRRPSELLPERAPATVPSQLFSGELVDEPTDASSAVDEHGLVIDFPE